MILPAMMLPPRCRVSREPCTVSCPTPIRRGRSLARGSLGSARGQSSLLTLTGSIAHSRMNHHDFASHDAAARSAASTGNRARYPAPRHPPRPKPCAWFAWFAVPTCPFGQCHFAKRTQLAMILPPTMLAFTFRRQLAATRLVRAHVSQPVRPPFAWFACFAVPTLPLVNPILPNEPTFPTSSAVAIRILRFANTILPNEAKLYRKMLTTHCLHSIANGRWVWFLPAGSHTGVVRVASSQAAPAAATFRVYSRDSRAKVASSPPRTSSDHTAIARPSLMRPWRCS
jgi:hypothetical protein